MIRLIGFLLIALTLFQYVPAPAQLTNYDRQELQSVNLFADLNPGFESGIARWTASPALVKVTSGSNKLIGGGSATWDSTSASQTVTSASFTMPNGYQGQNCEFGVTTMVPSGTATHLVQLQVNFDFPISKTIDSSTLPKRNTAIIACPAGGTTVKARILSVASNEPLIVLDNLFFGPSSAVESAQVDTSWAAYTPAVVGLGTGSGTSNGQWRRVSDEMEISINFVKDGSNGSGSAAVTFAIPAGYTVDTSKLATVSGAYQVRGYALDALTGQTMGIVYNPASPGTVSGYNSSGFYPGSSFSASRVYSLKFSLPIVGWTASTIINTNQQKTPTVVTYSTGSGTYTPKPGVTYIRARLVGPGGGGSGSGTSGSIAGGSGSGATTLGTLSGGAGNGANSTTPGTPGSCTIGTGWSGTAITGGMGATSFYTRSVQDVAGGAGGASMFGGGGAGGPLQAGSTPGYDGQAWGSGGGGGGFTNINAGYVGTGGSAGGGCDAIYSAPGAMSYSVGTGGTGGSAGVSGNAGGAGKGGYIEITEYYGYTTAMIANSVSTTLVPGVRIEFVDFTCNSSATINRQSSNMSIGNISSGSCAITYNTNWSAEPSCNFTITNANGNAYTANIFSKSSTVVTVHGYAVGGGNLTNYSGSLICVGAR